LSSSRRYELHEILPIARTARLAGISTTRPPSALLFHSALKLVNTAEHDVDFRRREFLRDVANHHEPFAGHEAEHRFVPSLEENAWFLDFEFRVPRRASHVFRGGDCRQIRSATR
jgi:hypothetical protein